MKLGDVNYNAIFSRFLNRNDTEDSAYLVGQPPPPPGSAYFGVFFEVQNESDEPAAAAGVVHDRRRRSPGASSRSPARASTRFPLGGEIEAEEQLPVLDSTPQQGPIEGSLVLFLLPDSASENRPLILEIPGEDESAEVTLDL